MAHRNALAWLEILDSDLDRAQTFYETLLGTTISPRDDGPRQSARCLRV